MLELGPAFRNVPPPIIVIGMHRSGTSVVAALLTILGIFLDPEMPPPAMGETLSPPADQLRSDGYGEAVAFRLLNERLLERAGSAWDEIDRFLRVRDDPDFIEWAANLLRLATLGQLDRDFMAKRPAYSVGWGWKDPRTSLTLPIWLKLFPDARVMHVSRDPERVVTSLIRREQSYTDRPTVASRLKRAITHPSAAVRAVERRFGLGNEVENRPSANDPQSYERLVAAYVNECERAETLVEQYAEIRLEELVADPHAAATALAEFAGVPSNSRSY